MLKEILIKKALDSALDRVRTFVVTRHVVVSMKPEDIESALAHHQRWVESWCRSVSFTELRGTKLLANVFIDLDLYVYPRRLRETSDESIATQPLKDVIAGMTSNLIILGQPGAGKTTSLKQIARTLFDFDDVRPDLHLPVVVPLGKLNEEISLEPGILVRHLCSLLGISVETPKGHSVPDVLDQARTFRERAVCSVLGELSTLLMLDGLDELAPQIRQDVMNDVRLLSTMLPEGHVLLTSRTGEFRHSVDHASQYELAPLNYEQLRAFATRWLGGEKAVAFLAAVKGSPFADTALRPLTLAHLCAIYDRVGTIPAKPKTVYRRVVGLLLGEWDEQRGVRRWSRFSAFEADRKQEFLAHLAFTLSCECRSSVFSREQFASAYNSICEPYGLVRAEIRDVASELESQTGLLLQSGFDELEFAHKSIQEHLTAEYIVRLPSIPGVNLIRLLPNELAIAVAISSDSSGYLTKLVVERALEMINHPDFVLPFIGRLIVERPELTPTHGAVLSLAILYACVASRTNDAGGDLDRTRETFESLMTPVFRQSGLAIIEQFYRFSGIDRERRLAMYRRNQFHSTLAHGVRLRPETLPAELVVPRDLVD